MKPHLKRGDAVIFTSLTRASLAYYLRDVSGKVVFYSYPLENARHLGYMHYKKFLNDPHQLLLDAGHLEEMISKQKGHSGRIFVVYVHNPNNGVLFKHLRRMYPRENVETIGDFRQSLIRIPVKVLRFGN